MAITYVGALEDATAGASPKTLAVNIGTRTNGLLVVAVCFYDNAMSTPAVTYAGVSMSLASEYPTTNGVYHVALYYLANPPTNGNLVLTWTGSNLAMYVLASWYDGVAQTSPLDQLVTGTGSTNPSLSITPTENNELIVSHYFSAANQELTVGAGETKIDGYDWGGDVTGGSYAIQTTAGAQTVDWAGADSTWYMVVASFKQAAAGGDQIKTITDTGAGADAIGGVAVSLALADTGSGAESFGAAASLALSDSGEGSDALAAILAALGITDSGAGGDSLGISAAVAVSDIGSGAEVVNQVLVTLTVSDAGAGADLVNILTGGLVSILESGAGVDGISIAVAPLSIADSGSGVDSLVIQATIGLSDTASGADAINVLQTAYKLVSELATGTDAIGNVSVSLAVPESGAGVDLIGQILAWVMLAETGSGVDVAVAFDSAVRIATITFSIARRTIAFTFASREIEFELAGREIEFGLSRRDIEFSLVQRKMDFDF